MLILLLGCAEPSISVWGKMDTGEASIVWDAVSFHLADTPWNDPWLPIPLAAAEPVLLTTSPTLLAEGTLPSEEFHHVFTDAASITQGANPLADIIEQIAAPFHADAGYNITVEYIVIGQNIFAKDCTVERAWP